MIHLTNEEYEELVRAAENGDDLRAIMSELEDQRDTLERMWKSGCKEQDDLRARVAAFQSTAEGGWFMAWETADKDRKDLRTRVAELESLIQDDGFAATFQSLGQYRSDLSQLIALELEDK